MPAPEPIATAQQPNYLSDEIAPFPPLAAPTENPPPAGASGIALPDRDARVTLDEVPTATIYRPGTKRPKLPFSTVDEAAILAADASLHQPAAPRGPTAKLKLFNSPPVEGHSFVFVIDRSASMGAGGLGAIGAAAKELSAQLASLTPDQKFQVVAYNESAIYFTGRELIAATDENKQKLVAYIANLTDFGQTEHERGLLAALRLKPEVIYLLTDGGDPHLRPGQINFLAEHCRPRTSIHCLHFGKGTADEVPLDHHLRRLAAESGGSYAFIAVGGRK